jgi:hypothetical protein
MADVAYLRIDPQATNRYEFKYDLKKLWNPDLNLFVSDQSGSELVVSTIDKIEQGKNIPVGLTVSEAGEYSLSFSFLPRFSDANNLYLIDRQEGKVVPISAGKYTFMVNETARSQRDRFYLSTDPVLPEQTRSQLIDVYPNPVKDKLTIRIPSDQTATIDIIDNQGKELFSGQMKGIYEMDMSNYAQGMYLLRIITEEGVSIRKITR